jgi:hypothetical protein
MHRQYTNASGNSDQNEEFTPEELQEFAQAFKVGQSNLVNLQET